MCHTKLIYLHGFNSSPDSFKARALREYLCGKLAGEKRNHVPQQWLDIPVIPPVPADAIKMLSHCVEEAQKQHTVALVGSSLGGFYATWLAEQYGLKAVLINPAVRPYDLLREYLGDNINFYTSERWVLDETTIEQLQALDVDRVTRPDHYLLMLQTGDEVLDYRQAVEKYSDCPSIIEEGGDHSFTNFENHIKRILSFCDIVL